MGRHRLAYFLKIFPYKKKKKKKEDNSIYDDENKSIIGINGSVSQQ